MDSLPQSYDLSQTANPTAGKHFLGTCPSCDTDHFGSRGEEIQYEACAVCGIPLCSACEQHKCLVCDKLLCADHGLRNRVGFMCSIACGWPKESHDDEGEDL